MSVWIPNKREVPLLECRYAECTKASFRLSAQIWFLCKSDWNPIIFRLSERQRTTWNTICPSPFRATFVCGLESYSNRISGNPFQSDSSDRIYRSFFTFSRHAKRKYVRRFCRKHADCLCRNKLVSLRSASQAEKHNIVLVYAPLWVLNVAETAAWNKAAHSSFLCFWCCLTRLNIIIQRKRDGKMLSCHKTTSVLQTVLLLLLFLAYA